MRWFISDPHFGHANIIKFCNRPFVSCEDMDQQMVKNWNDVVGHEDTIYCMGDFGRPAFKYAHRLHGYKVLVLGNHDKRSQCEGHFNEIHESLDIEIDGKLVHLDHFPYREQVGPHDTKFIKRMKPDDGNWLIHGHTHNSSPFLINKSINVSADWVHFKPISEDAIVKIMRQQIL